MAPSDSVLRRLRASSRTAVADLRYQGAGVVFWKAIVKLLSPLVRLDVEILYDLDLKQPIEQRPPKIECRIEQATEADLDRIVEMREPQADERRIAKEKFLMAMRTGECCFVARVDGEIAHSNWTRFHGCAPIADRSVDLLPGEIYTTDAFTDERWRGMCLHEAVLSHMLRFAQSRGCHHAYTITNLIKGGARRGLVRAAPWRPRGKILFIGFHRLGRTRLVRLSGDVEPIFRHTGDAVASDLPASFHTASAPTPTSEATRPFSSTITAEGVPPAPNRVPASNRASSRTRD